MKEINLPALKRLIDGHKKESFIFLIGAGASFTSGIQLAGPCIDDWKLGIYQSETDNFTNGNKAPQEWFDKQGGYPKNGDPGEYTHYAEECLISEESRRNYFNKLCKGSHPSEGYDYLSRFMKKGFSEVVITTNFDDLLSKSFYKHDLQPVRLNNYTYPLLNKQIESTKQVKCVYIHGDIIYGFTKNTGPELSKQDEEIQEYFKTIFSDKHLIVLGYSGRDESLMTSLEAALLNPGNGKVIWCSYQDENIPEAKRLLTKVAQNLDGHNRDTYLVKTNGFDETLKDLYNYCYRTEIAQVNETSPVNTQEEVLSQPISTNKNRVYNLKIVTFFCASWCDSLEGDKIVISEYSGTSYSDFIGYARTNRNNEELRFSEGLWGVVTPGEYREYNAPLIYDEHLEKAIEVAVKFYSTPPESPAPYSKELKDSLLSSLLFINYNKELFLNCSQSVKKAMPWQVVRQVFDGSDWQLWQGLGDFLPGFAELCPEEFLTQLGKWLLNKPEELIKYIKSNNANGLRRALEALAWSPKYLARVCVLLAEIDGLDNDRQQNSYFRSIQTILLPWLPQTLAPVESLINAYKAVFNVDIELARQLLKNLLPVHGRQISFGTTKPKYLIKVPEDYQPASSEVRNYIMKLIEFAVEKAEDDDGLLIDLIENIRILDEEQQMTVLTCLTSPLIKKLPEEKLFAAWSKLCDFTNKNRQFTDAKWATPEAILSKLDPILIELKPEDKKLCYSRYFNSSSTQYLFNDRLDYKEREIQLEKLRKNALQEIYDNEKIEGINEFINCVESPQFIGALLPEIRGEGLDSYYLPKLLIEATKGQEVFISAYVWKASQVDQWWDALDREGWSHGQNAKLLCYLRFNKSTWDLVDVVLNDKKDLYWREVIVRSLQADEGLENAIAQLLKYERFSEAIECIQHQLFKGQGIDNNLCYQVLIEASKQSEILNTMHSYQLSEIINALQKDETFAKAKLLEIEWAYMKYLRWREDIVPQTILQRLTEDPLYFTEILKVQYGVDGGEPELTKQARDAASNAWELFSIWENIPGMDENGKVSVSKFTEWFSVACQKSEDIGRLKHALSQLGELLGRYSNGKETDWIPEELLTIIDDSSHESMRRGYFSGVYNSRGAHYVDPQAGPELKLVELWEARAEEIGQYTRFASQLRSIASTYQDEADRIIAEH